MSFRLRGTFLGLLAAALFAVNVAWARVSPDPVEERGARAHADLSAPRATEPATSARSGPATAERTRPGWKRRLDRLVAGRTIGVAVHSDGEILYEHGGKKRRVPASNQKLLLAMALLETFARTHRIPTVAAASPPAGGVVGGNLWLLGQGDPSVTGSDAYAKSLPFRATRLGRLARGVKETGVTRITGSVVGGTGYFERDWWAPGWKDYFPAYYVALPSSLTFNGNRAGGKHIDDPERRAARALTKKLRKVGVRVEGRPGAGVPPEGLVELARVRSAPLEKLLRYTSRSSSNFFAEVLGKRAGVEDGGVPGTIAKGASAIARYASARRVGVDAHDSSGLSYANRLSARGLVRLLDDAEDQEWGMVLRRILPTGGQGTLQHRLRGVSVRAKTGTLRGHSALSGYVWAERRGEWISFAIISSGMDKGRASAVEDEIVRVLERRAR